MRAIPAPVGEYRGPMLILGDAPKGPTGRRQWRYRCHCGNEGVRAVSDLNGGAVRSCQVCARHVRGPSAQRKCAECGAEFTAKAHKLRKRQGKFCSRRCMYAPEPVEQRLWRSVDKQGPTIRAELGPCWVWTGFKDRKGYGRLGTGTKREGNRRGEFAHRLSFKLQHGHYPRNALHRCDNPPCVRPDHLFDGTAADNTADMMAKGRNRRGVAPSGEAHPCHKISLREAREIKRRLAGGEAGGSVATALGISHHIVYDISRGKTWRAA